MNRRRAIILILILVVAGTLSSTYFTTVRAGNGEKRFDNIGTVMEVVALIKTRYYYQPISTFDLVKDYIRHGTINGMLRSALEDPYTRYMDPQAFEQMMLNTKGEYGGIGIVVGIQDDRLTVVSPIKGTPGEGAGLRGGDKIMAIDGKDSTFMSLDEAVSLMRGPVGEDINLLIQRDEESIPIHIVRALINVESVAEPKMLDKEIGYVHITNFSDRTYEELTKALRTLDEQGMKGLVIDLRFNPGGTLNAAIQVSNEFIANGPLVFLEDKDGNRTPYEAMAMGTRMPMPIVVLINGGSASASEIVSGALRDHGLAALVGTTTFGKGLVQSMYPLRDGSAITITEQAYLTAGGHNINKIGIEPDIEVEVSKEEEEAIYLGEAEVDKQLDKALEVLRGKLR